MYLRSETGGTLERGVYHLPYSHTLKYPVHTDSSNSSLIKLDFGQMYFTLCNLLMKM